MSGHNNSAHGSFASMSEVDWVQIVAVLLTMVEPGKKRTKLADNVQLCGHYLCVCGREGADPGDDLKGRSDVSKLTAEELPRSILVIDPALSSADQVVQARKKWSDCCRKIGEKTKLEASLEIWDAEQTKRQILQVPPLALRYFVDDLSDGPARTKRIASIRARYDAELRKLYGKIQFIGMSVYKEEATAAVDMEAIYIPLRLVSESADEANPDTQRTDPSRFLARGERHVILGDPGSGKSTLFRFLALAGTHRPLQERYHVQPDDRLPMLVTLRQFADALKADAKVDILDYVVETTARDFGLENVDREFFEYYLYAGKSIILFDGVDELPGLKFKQDVRARIAAFLEKYPANTALVTSRIVGYDKEIRYEGLGFSHHRVARLAVVDIERFVANWYTVRIQNRAEQTRNVDDLLRIVRDPSSRAIRELAENPLLLTIMCLVHRVDAVLPDERVVLYQKCTETLLNTWHTWKFRNEDTRNRSRVEKQNHARMEFIAYTMHGALDTTDPSQRSIVPHDDLVDILAEYIREIEKPRTGEPGQLAEVFLKFVRERAGLLIEVGQGQYSFVHLTFQEYLAAVHLKNSGEVGGVEVIWETFIRDRCATPRWHEVIRLLIGCLKQDRSQRYFLERIVLDNDEKDVPERAVLAGGCLLDGIAAAEEMADDIIRSLLVTAARSDSLDALRKTLHQLSALQERNSEYIECIAKHAAFLSDEQPQLAIRLTLCLIALGWQDEKIEACCSLPTNTDRAATLLNELLVEEPTSSNSLCNNELELLHSLQRELSLNSLSNAFYLRFAAVALCIAHPRATSELANPAFEHILTTLVHVRGPFFELTRNAIQIALANSLGSQYPPRFPMSRVQDLARAGTRARGMALDRSLARGVALDRSLDRSLDRDRPRDSAWDRTWGRARAQVWAQARALNRDMNRDLRLHHDLDGELDRVRSSASYWCEVEARRELHGPVLDIVCDLFDLNPRAQWCEALRVRSLPRVPNLITWVDPTVWKRTLLAFRSSKQELSDCRHAASQLLLDIWLFVFDCIDSPSQSPFFELAELTQRHPSVYLRVAHCLRDLAYGDETRADDLKAMVKSEDPEYRQLFLNSFWRD